MKRFLFAFLALAFASAPLVQAKNPIVEMKTSAGTIKIELFEDKAPVTVENFLKYVKDKHYDGTVFHRVIPTFMIQGGGFTKDITSASSGAEIEKAQKKTRDAIKNEAKPEVSNARGTLAMARTNNPDSATSQFFINVKDNKFLDKSGESAGYAVFGKVIEGMDVVDKIKDVKTKELVPGFKDVPVESVVIESVKQVDK
jgi:cyclophilin family peptidyl-prolyl cis-trans isomerase